MIFPVSQFDSQSNRSLFVQIRLVYQGIAFLEVEEYSS